MSTSRPGSELRQPKLISVPVPPQHDAAHNDSVEASFWCFEAHCVVQNGKTIHVYALPAFALVQSIPLPSYSPVYDDALDLHNDQLAIAFPNGRLDIWNIQTRQCEVVQDYTLGNMSEFLEGDLSVSFMKPSPVHSGNQDAKAKDIQLQDPIIVILETPEDLISNLWIWSIPRFRRFDPSFPDSSTADQKPSFFRRINTNASIRSFDTANRKIVAACEDCTIRIWDIITGDCNWVLMGHSSPCGPLAVSFSVRFTNHDRIFSNSLDGAIRIWDMGTGDCRVLSSHPGPAINWARHSASYIVGAYRTLGTSSQPETEILVWSMPSEKLKYRFCYVPEPGWQTMMLYVTDHQIILEFSVSTPESSGMCCKIWDLPSGAPLGEFWRHWQGLSLAAMHGFSSHMKFHIALFDRHGTAALEVVDFSAHVGVPLREGDEEGPESKSKGVEIPEEI
ncbi:hypothetical protein CVT26_012458 [Gymnopilus dilepis]|uniref:Uncharacterized protein n=1 Tax=Gymnopilus dilepis TaxID=231916 RepID=A0A409YCS9_9AGAR|nr:hypothetical protein CVT26_012458 [Gymnopilus dilepis]